MSFKNLRGGYLPPCDLPSVQGCSTEEKPEKNYDFLRQKEGSRNILLKNS
jgi:hypothetical protein